MIHNCGHYQRDQPHFRRRPTAANHTKPTWALSFASRLRELDAALPSLGRSNNLAGNRGNWVDRPGQRFAMEPITERRGGALRRPRLLRDTRGMKNAE